VRTIRRTTVFVGAALPVMALIAGGVVSSGTASAKTPTPKPAKVAKLQILVTNDDGYNAPGIAAVSSALAKLPNVKVTVVAPLNNSSGSGGSTTPGKLTITKRKTLNGMPAYAVDGFPADAVRAALTQLHLTPDLVVSGINAGQNLGPVADLSGTVGAARAAVARGIPAIAVSSGFSTTQTFRFAAAVPLLIRWINHSETRLLHHTAPLWVHSMNVPSCPSGVPVRGLVHIRADLSAKDFSKALATPNCKSKSAPGKTDVSAWAVGFATVGTLPLKPAK
jgi:5'-nucleotidase